MNKRDIFTSLFSSRFGDTNNLDSNIQEILKNEIIKIISGGDKFILEQINNDLENQAFLFDFLRWNIFNKKQNGENSLSYDGILNDYGKRVLLFISKFYSFRKYIIENIENINNKNYYKDFLELFDSFKINRRNRKKEFSEEYFYENNYSYYNLLNSFIKDFNKDNPDYQFEFDDKEFLENLNLNFSYSIENKESEISNLSIEKSKKSILSLVLVVSILSNILLMDKKDPFIRRNTREGREIGRPGRNELFIK